MKRLAARTQLMNNDERLPAFRSSPIVYQDGKPVQTGDELQYQLIGLVVPLNSRDLLLVPEGDRHKEQYFVMSEQREIRPQVNDRVVREGANYQVQSSENWGSYTRVRIMKDDVGPAAGGTS